MRIAFLFPGQGSQYKGMFGSHWKTAPLIRQTFEEASDALGYDLYALCAEASEAELAEPQHAQPALLAAGVAAYRSWTACTGIAAAAFAGHSLGEYTALACAGAIPFRDAVEIVRERGLLMRQAAAGRAGGMLAASGMTAVQAEAMLAGMPQFAEELAIACYNSERQQVFAGSEVALQAVEQALLACGARPHRLKVGAAFHSPLMAEAAGRLEAVLQERSGRFMPPAAPVISNVSAEPHAASGETVIPGLVRQMTEPVRWRQSMTHLDSLGIDLAIDSGPQRTLKHLLLQDDPSAAALACDAPDDHAMLFASGWRQQAGRRSSIRLLEACLAAATAARNRNGDLPSYREGVVRPYKELEALALLAERQGREPTVREVREGLRLLDRILTAKGVERAERHAATNAIRDAIHRKEGTFI